MEKLRARRGSLTRDGVVDVALRLLDEDGIESVSFRRIAAELGTTPMALYGYVDDRDDLLLELVDRRLALEALPTGATGEATILDHCYSLRDLFTRNPWMVSVFLTRPVVTVQALRRMDHVLGALRADGLDIGSAATLYGITTTFVIGFTAVEIGRTSHQGDSDHWSEFFGSLDEPDYPNVVALAPHARNLISPAGFADGLSSLIEGLWPA